MATIKDLEELILALCLKQIKYNYKLITETMYYERKKCLYRSRTIVKYHIEVLPSLEDSSKNKRYRIEDDKVTGNFDELLNYLVNELKGFDDA